MAIRNIRYEGDEILRKKAREVESIDQKILTLIEDMAETMYESGGVGLAAPQVGILKRICVIDVGQGLIVLINPKIIDQKGEQVVIEGCLSIPSSNGGLIQGELIRPAWVKVSALDRMGKEFVIEGEELLAQALSHEIDHLDGILFLDKVNRIID